MVYMGLRFEFCRLGSHRYDAQPRLRERKQGAIGVIWEHVIGQDFRVLRGITASVRALAFSNYRTSRAICTLASAQVLLSHSQVRSVKGASENDQIGLVAL